ncbi:MAG: flavodoxin family protein [Clostridia bacterium]|nr:flavodoxin family protein [Clostridia bacterium]
MKVILFNGSTHPHGCTAQALNIVAQTLNQQGIDTGILSIGSQAVHDCIACGGCKKGTPACVFHDDCVNTWLEKVKAADGFVFGSPVYYAHPTGALLSAMDRMFYAGSQFFRHKPAAAVLTARRAGTTASMDIINKYFTINQMPVVASSYWNQIYRDANGTPTADTEGLQVLTHLGNNMAWLLKCIAAGKQQGITAPAQVKTTFTNFVQ